MKTITRILSVSLLAAISATADTFTWDGGGTSNTWLTAANWSSDIVPASDGSALLAFSGGTRTATTNTFSGETSFAGINFLNDATTGKTAGFTLAGNRLTLGGNIVSTSSSSSITDTIALNFLLSGTRTLTQNNNHHLTISGVIGDTGSGAYGLIKAGAGTLRLTATNTFTGPVTNNAGYLYFNSIKNIGGGASALGAPTTLENGTIRAASRIYYNGTTSTATDRPLIVSGELQYFNETAGITLTLDGPITGASAISFRGPGIFSVNGLIALTNDVSRTDNGTVYLNNPANIFTGSLSVKDGIISTATLADSGQACAIGIGSQISLGQNAPYNTTGTFQFTGANGASCNRSIRILSATNTAAYGGKIENTVTGQTLTLSGPITVDSGASKPAPVWLMGAGNGVVSGSIGAGLRLIKAGSGTWTLSGANALTSSVMVSTGTLLVNGSLAPDSTVSVEAGATLGGTGTISGRVAVATGGILAPGAGSAGTLTLANTGSAALALTNSTFACELTGAGASDRLDIAGTLALTGENVIALQLPNGTAPAGTYTLVTYSALNSTAGSLVLDRTYPNATFTVGDTNVMLTITGTGTTSNLTWKGDSAANLWDTTSDNWTPGLFGNGMALVFDDTGSDSPAIAIDAAGVMPRSITMNTTTRNYTFNGGAITSPSALIKNGSGLLTLNNPNTYGGAILLNGGKLTVNAALASAGINVSSGTVLTQGVASAFSGSGAMNISGSATLLGSNSYTGATTLASGGTLVLGGTLNGSSLMVNTNATFSQSASSVIAGSSVAVTLQSTTTLAGTNSYDGATTLGVLGIPNLTYTINSSNALGSTVGGTLLYGGTGSTLNRLVLGKNITIANEPLTLSGNNDYRSGLAYNQTSGTGTWAGVVACIGSAYIESMTAGGTLAIGLDDTTLVTNAASCSLSMRGNGNILLNSRIRIGTGYSLLRNDTGTLIINATSNVWGDTGLSEGTIRMNVANGLPSTTLLTIGKGDKKSLCVFDLNGFDQTIRGLADVHFAGDTGTQRILSALPATLTISNDTARSFGKEGSTIEGVVTLNKVGASTLTLTSTNAYSGATIVSNGTLAVSASGTLGTNSLSVVIGGTGTLALSASNAIPDTAAIQMPARDVTTAKLQLDTGVVETVGWLLYGDVIKRSGTYGATNSGADYIDNTHFSGEGKLRVLFDKSGTLIKLR